MAKGTKLPKPKTCKCCKEKFIPTRPLQFVCSGDCAYLYQKRQKEKQQQTAEAKSRREWRERKAKLKTASDWNKEAQIAVNRYIFWRDYGDRCIACGCALNYGVRGGAVDASHYRSRGSASHLRFNIFNIHAGCVRCNRSLSGNLISFRINLIEKIGAERVDRLEQDNAPRKFNIGYLKRLKEIFTRRARHYEKLRKRQQEAA